jgi:hypothetical protein
MLAINVRINPNKKIALKFRLAFWMCGDELIKRVMLPNI